MADPDARRRAEEALRRVLANAATIVRLSWSDGATAADRANLERIKSAAADIAQDHKILRALLTAMPQPKATTLPPEVALPPRPAQDAVKRALVEMRDDLQRLTGSANYGTVIRLTERLTGLIIDIDAAPAQDAVREAAEVVRTILTAHDARLSESGCLTYGPPSKGTGFVAAIQWLRRYDAARGGE